MLSCNRQTLDVYVCLHDRRFAEIGATIANATPVRILTLFPIKATSVSRFEKYAALPFPKSEGDSNVVANAWLYGTTAFRNVSRPVL